MLNLCQKYLFLHQLTHNITTDCSLNYKFNTWKFQAQTWGEHIVYRNCFWHSEQFLYTTCSLSPCSAKRRASDKDLPVCRAIFSYQEIFSNKFLLWKTINAFWIEKRLRLFKILLCSWKMGPTGQRLFFYPLPTALCKNRVVDSFLFPGGLVKVS